MEIEYFGANALRVTTKKASLTIDDNLKALSAKSITKPQDVALFTSASPSDAPENRLTIASPGQYEVSDISIEGIAARSHMDEDKGPKSATIFKIVADDIKLAVLGHIYPELSDTQLESLGTVDVLIIPVGGGGYTLDALGALEVIKKIEPKIIIPTHYDDKSLKYTVPQVGLDEVLKNLAMEPAETLPKLKIKPQDFGIDDATKLIILERQ